MSRATYQVYKSVGAVTSTDSVDPGQSAFLNSISQGGSVRSRVNIDIPATRGPRTWLVYFEEKMESPWFAVPIVLMVASLLKPG